MWWIALERNAHISEGKFHNYSLLGVAKINVSIPAILDSYIGNTIQSRNNWKRCILFNTIVERGSQSMLILWARQIFCIDIRTRTLDTPKMRHWFLFCVILISQVYNWVAIWRALSIKWFKSYDFVNICQKHGGTFRNAFTLDNREIYIFTDYK